MAKEIESGKLLVKEAFDLWFRIPEYQRPYVWGKDQITELIDDIAESHRYNPEAEYFLGSLVLQKQTRDEAGSSYTEYDVLDGQQRLTTLFLLTAFIRDRTPKVDRKETCQRSIYRRANTDDGIPERVRMNYEVRGKAQEFIDLFVKEEGGTTKLKELAEWSLNEKDLNVRNMAAGLLVMEDYFRGGGAISFDDFFPYLRNKVLLIFVSTEGLEDAFRLFTVLNDRGLKLRNSDILKAENLRMVEDPHKRAEYARLWEEIEDSLGDGFDNFLSNVRTVLVKEKARVNLLEEYEENIYHPKKFDRDTRQYTPRQPLLEKGEATFKYIKAMFGRYDKLINLNTVNLLGSYKVDNLLVMMQKVLPADFWLAPVLLYSSRFPFDRLDEFLVKLDNKFSCDWIIGLTPTERIENMNAVLRAIEAAQSADEVLLDASFKTDWTTLEQVLEGPVYGRRFARYILFKLDFIFHGDTTPLNPPDTVSVEHILPQNPKPDSDWCRNFTPEQRMQYTDRIGNLVLISRKKNSTQGNLDYADKRTRYLKGYIETFSNSIRLLTSYDAWTPEQGQLNTRLILKKLKEHYSA